MSELSVNHFYTKNTLDNAEILFRELFYLLPSPFNDSNQLSILVIGAGTFPSFIPLIQMIKNISPMVCVLNFNLIDLDANATTYFKNFINTANSCLDGITVNIIINNIDIKDYLINATNEHYELIYFERPDSSVFNFLFTHLNLPSSRFAISLLESIPYLRNVTKSNTIIMGSFLNKEDINHFQRLLKYCLGVKTKKVTYKTLRERRGFNFGSVGIFNETELPKKSPEQLVSSIKLARIYFYLFFLSSIILFILAPIELKTISFLFVIAQLFIHHYGIKGIAVRCLLIIGQMLL